MILNAFAILEKMAFTPFVQFSYRFHQVFRLWHP